MLSDDPVSSSVHPNSSLLGEGSEADAVLLGPSDSHSNVSSTTTDHQASTSQFLGHLDGIPGSSNHDDIFFTGNNSRSINPGTNPLQNQNNSNSSVGINNIFSNNNGASSKGGPPSQQSFGPSSVSASSISNPSPQQPHTPHTPQPHTPHTPQPHTPHTPRSHPIPSPSPVGAVPMASPVNSVPMTSPVASLPPPSPAQNQVFSKPLKSPASVPGMASSIKSPMNIAPPSPSPNSNLSSQSQTNQILNSSSAVRPASVALSSISSSAPLMRGVASVTQNQQIQSAQGQVLLSAQPTMIQGGSTMLTGTPVVQQGVPTLIQTATGGLMQINLQPQLGAIGSVANQVNVPTSARLPLALNSVAATAPATSLVSSIAQNANANTKGASASRQQPQILPKYSTMTGGKPAASLQYTIAATQNTPVAQTQTFTTGASPLLLSTGGAVLQTLQGVATASPQTANQIVLGQNLVVGNAAQPVQNSPFLIQQPNGNPPVIMVRSNPPIQQSTPTILPIGSQAAGTPAGTLLLQQPQAATANGATAAGMITAQPQVKIITPQGRMQVQQIQTPSGPKLITVPVGQGIAGQTTAIVPQAIQTATPTVPGGANTVGQIQQIAGSAAFASIGNPTIVSNLPTTLAAPSSSGLPTSLIQSVPTMGGMGLPISTHVSSSSTTLVGVNSSTSQQTNNTSETTNSQLTTTPKSSGTKKKSKRKGKKPDPMAAATTAVVNSALEAVGQKPPTRSGGLDLGELMKDVGLDLEGFGVDEASAQAALSAAANPTVPTLQPTLPIVPQQVFNTSQGGTGTTNIVTPIQGISVSGGSLSINAASASTMSVSGAANLPLLNNTQTMAAASLTPSQGALASPGNQLVAQIQQPLPLQVSISIQTLSSHEI